jgi:hypothetical protein
MISRLFLLKNGRLRKNIRIRKRLTARFARDRRERGGREEEEVFLFSLKFIFLKEQYYENFFIKS